MAFSNRGRTKKGRSRGKKGSRHTSDESDLLKGIDGPERIQTNARNTDSGECFSEASNTRRGRSGKIEDLSKGDAAHLKGQNDTQQFMQQSQNDVGKCRVFLYTVAVTNTYT